MKVSAKEIVDALLGEGRLIDLWREKWGNIKSATGIGSDGFGLGKNTEKGWKPKYNATGARPRQQYRHRTAPSSGSGQTWTIS